MKIKMAAKSIDLFVVWVKPEIDVYSGRFKLPGETFVNMSSIEDHEIINADVVDYLLRYYQLTP